MTDSLDQTSIRTRAVHAGERPDPVTRAASPNIVMSSTYIADPDTTFSVAGQGDDAPYIYTRWSNPTVDQLERKLAALDGAEAGLAFASGMAAITALFLHQLQRGDRLVMSDISYAGASELAEGMLRGMGVDVVRANMADLEQVRADVTPGTKLVYAETPANPIMRLTDLRAVAKIAHAAGALLAVDSTYATPVGTRPIELGADYVVHSLTKYISGHGDTLGGAVLGPQEELARLRSSITVHTGGILSPFNAWLTMRGAATLPLRMEAHQAGAFAVARFLEGHPKVRQVLYPGLPSHPQHTLATQQMSNYSGMLTFRVDDGRRAAGILAERLRIWHYAVSLGHHRSLLFYLPTDEMLANSFPLDPAGEESYRAYAGDGVFRVSVGIEDPADLIADLEQALEVL
ncbi:MAG: trans-sulfuration enzyme family protein [Anaerolineales bacterium]